MNRYMVFGEFDSDNLGDVLLGKSQKFLYEKNGKNIVLSNLSNTHRNSSVDPVDHANKAYNPSILKKIHRKVYSDFYLYRHILDLSSFALKRKDYFDNALMKISIADKVIIGGGQLFSDNSLRMLLHIYCITKTADAFKVDKFIVGSGTPTPKSYISKFLIKKIFSYYNKESVFLRDEKSISVINSIAKLDLTIDNVLPDFAITYVDHLRDKLSPVEGKIIGLAPISLDCMNSKQRKYNYNQDDWWISIADYIEKRGYKPVLFCHGTNTDYKRCKDIQIKAYEQGFEIVLLPRPIDVDTYITMVNSFTNVLCQRLHISITAFSLNKSPVSLPWDDKIKCFYDEAGITDHFIKNENINYKDIFDMLIEQLDLTQQRDQLIKKTSSIIKGIS